MLIVGGLVIYLGFMSNSMAGVVIGVGLIMLHYVGGFIDRHNKKAK
jgi:hypothetical protein